MNNSIKTTIAPSSKSSSLRALLCCLLNSENKLITLKNISLCDDVQAGLKVLKDLKNVSYKTTGNNLIIENTGLIDSPNVREIMVGESGFLARSLVSLASLFTDEIVIKGQGTILNRDLAIRGFCEKVGLQANSSCLPTRIKGRVEAGEFIINEKISSQFLSGLLFILPLLEQDSTISIQEIVSQQYILLTLDYLKRCQIKVISKATNTFIIPGNQKYDFQELLIESDWSSLSYLIVLGLFRGGVKITNIIDSQVSPDRVILDLLDEIGGKYNLAKDNTLLIEKSDYRGFNFDLISCPDLAPVLVSLALFANSPSRLMNCFRLINKESNRLKSLIDMLETLKANYNYQEGSLIIFPSKISNGKVKTYNDHRIAMAALILNAHDTLKIQVDNYECINKSYPSFITDLEKLGVKL